MAVVLSFPLTPGRIAPIIESIGLNVGFVVSTPSTNYTVNVRLEKRLR